MTKSKFTADIKFRFCKHSGNGQNTASERFSQNENIRHHFIMFTGKHFTGLT